MADNGPSKGVDEKKGEGAAEFALSLAENWIGNFKGYKLVSQHSHRKNYLIFSLGVCIVDVLAITTVRPRRKPATGPQGITAIA